MISTCKMGGNMSEAASRRWKRYRAERDELQLLLF